MRDSLRGNFSDYIDYGYNNQKQDRNWKNSTVNSYQESTYTDSDDENMNNSMEIRVDQTKPHRVPPKNRAFPMREQDAHESGAYTPLGVKGRLDMRSPGNNGFPRREPPQHNRYEDDEVRTHRGRDKRSLPRDSDMRESLSPARGGGGVRYIQMVTENPFKFHEIRFKKNSKETLTTEDMTKWAKGIDNALVRRIIPTLVDRIDEEMTDLLYTELKVRRDRYNNPIFDPKIHGTVHTFLKNINTRVSLKRFRDQIKAGWNIDAPDDYLINDGYKSVSDAFMNNKLYVDPLNETTHQPWVLKMKELIKTYKLNDMSKENPYEFDTMTWKDMWEQLILSIHSEKDSKRRKVVPKRDSCENELRDITAMLRRMKVVNFELAVDNVAIFIRDFQVNMSKLDSRLNVHVVSNLNTDENQNKKRDNQGVEK